MQIIKRLPIHLANQIAAGEVVQRPSSVVKELLENSIDAGAKRIVLSVKDGGRTQLLITDDGRGMGKDDAMLCFERHATSKLNAIEDLFSLHTKGFRGEALASIGAISQVILKTRTEDEETGTLIKFEGGNCIETTETVCPVGTSLEVKNLFFNVPARRNFLKSDAIEFNHIEDEFFHIALAHPEVSFQFFNNQQELFNLPAVVLKKRIADLLGKNGSEKIFPIETKTDIIGIEGYIGKPETARKSRGEQYFFVNQRYFKNSYFHHAVSKAFEGLIPEKTYPSYFIFFEIDPAKIDVNIHPTKTEIKFEEDRFIYSILHSTVRQSLGMYNIAPSLDFNLDTVFDLPHGFREQPVVAPVIKVDPTFNPFKSQKSNGNSQAIRDAGFGTESQVNWQSLYEVQESLPESPKLFEDASETAFKEFIVSGKFIIATTNNGILLIDSKKAMERIYYDQVIQSFISQPLHHQMLLFPIEKQLAKNEIRAITTHTNILTQLGFQFTLNEEILEIIGAPEIIEESGILECFEALITTLNFQDQDQGDLAHILVREMTKQSSKFIQIKSNEEAQYVMEKLFASEEPNVSPSNESILKMIPFDQLSNLLK